MDGRELITASMRELEWVKVIEAVIEGRLRCFQAAERLQLGERQISRLCRRYEAAGPAGLVSAKRGRPSNRELSVDLGARTMALAREYYADFGPSLACEKLRECRLRTSGYSLMTFRKCRTIFVRHAPPGCRDCLINKGSKICRMPRLALATAINPGTTSAPAANAVQLHQDGGTKRR